MDNNQIEKFKSVVESSLKIVGFTGAGISTESGISDYRSQGGLWDKFTPVYFEEFLANEKKRIEYWERKQAVWDSIYNAQPNKGHLFFKELYDQGKLTGMITQNIDGLHEKSGLPKEIIINLHGNTLETKCLDCGFILPSQQIFNKLDLAKPAPRCPECKGLLKPNTISFGQQLNPEDLDKARQLCLDCDLLITMGSTLIVQPAASFPHIAKQNKAKLAIINLSDTPLDNYADFVFNMKIGDFIEKLI